MHIASWPGRLDGNAFLEVLFGSLERLGNTIVPIESPSNGISPQCQALLIQWPDRIFWKARPGTVPYKAAMAEITALWNWRRAGRKLVWVVHNHIPHDLNTGQKRLWKYYAAALAQIAHGYMTLSPATRETVLRVHPLLRGKPYAFFRHPAYPGVERGVEQQRLRREQLGLPLNACVVGSLGKIRPYKGVPDLIAAFHGIADANLRLLICGQVKDGSLRGEIERMSKRDTRILLNFDLVSDEDYALNTAACDGLVAPFKDYLHSGSLVYGMSARRKALTPRTPFAEDLAECVGPGWLSLYDGGLTTDILRQFISSTPGILNPVLSELEPSKAARKIVEFCSYLRRHEGGNLVGSQSPDSRNPSELSDLQTRAVRPN